MSLQSYSLRFGQPRQNSSLFKKPEEAECLTKMAQGRRPACCCLSEECLLSGKKKKKTGAGTSKTHRPLKGPGANPARGSELAPCLRPRCRSRGFGIPLQPTDGSGVRSAGVRVPGFANAKLAAYLGGCLLFVGRWLLIYLERVSSRRSS